jgi:DNA-binding NtrC family response regulator
LIRLLHILSHCTPGTSHIRTSKPHIAIIDDEKDLLFVYKKALELQGLKVVTFDDSSVALIELKKRNKEYCMVIVDIRMPKVNGYQFINEIKSIDPFIKIILMSAYDVSELEVQDNLNNGVIIDSIMHKPFSLIKLINTVNTLLEIY